MASVTDGFTAFTSRKPYEYLNKENGNIYTQDVTRNAAWRAGVDGVPTITAPNGGFIDFEVRNGGVRERNAR